jgi:hypothetical protein
MRTYGFHSKINKTSYKIIGTINKLHKGIKINPFESAKSNRTRRKLMGKENSHDSWTTHVNWHANLRSSIAHEARARWCWITSWGA